MTKQTPDQSPIETRQRIEDIKLSAGLKRFMPRSLFIRSMLILITPVLIIQAFTTFMFFERHWDKVTERFALALAGEIAIIAHRYENYAVSKDSPLDISSYALQYLSLNVSFDNQETLVKTDNRYFGWEQIVVSSMQQALNEHVQRPYNLNLSVEEKWIEIDIQLANGVLHVSAPIRRVFSSSSYIFLLWMIGSSLFMLSIAILFMRNQIRPIRRLAAAAERYGKGRDVPYLKPSGAREIRAAIRAFGTMKERLDRQIKQRTAMLAGVSHDLRTPITRMKLQLSMMPDHQDVIAMQKDLAEMEQMIEAYLDFVRGQGDEEIETLDLQKFIRDLIQESWRGTDAIIFEVDVTHSFFIKGRPIGLRRCLNNVIENGLKYGGKVWISLEIIEEEESILLIFEDDGPGIDQGFHQDVFKPFFRIEPSRNQQTGGVGLGLPVVQDIVHAHGGDIHLGQSVQHGGLSVRITLPL